MRDIMPVPLYPAACAAECEAHTWTEHTDKNKHGARRASGCQIASGLRRCVYSEGSGDTPPPTASQSEQKERAHNYNISHPLAVRLSSEHGGVGALNHRSVAQRSTPAGRSQVKSIQCVLPLAVLTSGNRVGIHGVSYMLYREIVIDRICGCAAVPA